MALKPYVPFAEFERHWPQHSHRTYIDPPDDGGGVDPGPGPGPGPDPVCEIEPRLHKFASPVWVSFLDTSDGLWSGDRDLPWASGTLLSGVNTGVGNYSATIPADGRMDIAFHGASGGDASGSLNWMSGVWMPVNVDVGLHVAVQSTASYRLDVTGSPVSFKAYFIGYCMTKDWEAPTVNPSAVVGVEEGQPWHFTPSERGGRRFVWLYSAGTLRLWATRSYFPPDFDYENEPFDSIINDYIQDVTEDYENQQIDLNNLIEVNSLPSTFTTHLGFGADFFLVDAAPGSYTVTLRCSNVGLSYLCEPIPE